MKLTLNVITEDDSFKKELKDLIRGQVTSVVREEIREILKEIMEKKLGNTEKSSIEAWIRSELNFHIRRTIFDNNQEKVALLKITEEEIKNKVEGFLGKDNDYLKTVLEKLIISKLNFYLKPS